MIAKHIPIKASKKSNFRELVQYIVSSQNKKERIECISVTNCNENSHLLATDEITATQRQNRRARSDRTYHLIISFPAGENPAIEIVHTIESRVCEVLGFGEHQRISALHTDTDHLHLHIAINKIHPHRFTIHNPYCDHKTLGSICDKLEIEYGLTRVNHQATNRGAQSQAFSMEAAGGMESLVGWIRRECLDGIRGAGDWQALHDTLQRNGLAIAAKGNGFVFTDGQGQQVKPSSVARDLSKPQLEKRLGSFKPSSGAMHKTDKTYQRKPMPLKQDTTKLYAAYQVAQSQRADLRKQAMTKAKNDKNTLVEVAKKEARQKRDAIRLFTQGELNRKVLYQLTSKSLKYKIQTINQQYRDACETLRKKGQRTSWFDWLQKQAVMGDVDALSALRARTGSRAFTDNRIVGEGDRTARPIMGLNFDSITKRGTVIYRDGAAAVREDGHQIHISKVVTKKALALSFALAMHRFGPSLKVDGTAEFKEQAVQFAASAKLRITFANPTLEKRRQFFISELPPKEINNDPDRRTRPAGRPQELGRRGRVTQRNQRGHGGLRKPDVARVGTRPPPRPKDRLRDLRELSMVHNAFGSELLLPSDVSRNVEQHQSQAIDGLRRKIPQSRRTVTHAGEIAAMRYIAERDEKRVFINDIPRHTFWAGESTSAAYVGWREKDGQPLVLLRSQNTDIIVAPVDAATLNRVKKLKMNEQIIFNKDGVIRKKGRRL